VPRNSPNAPERREGLREALTAGHIRERAARRVERADVVGHLVQMAITLAGGQHGHLEAHVDKYRRNDLVPSSSVWIAWHPHNATIVAA